MLSSVLLDPPDLDRDEPLELKAFLTSTMVPVAQGQQIQSRR